MPLIMMKPGDYGSILGINGEDDIKNKLTAMGFVGGAKIKVIGVSGNGIILEVKGTRIALNRGLAQILMVQV